jgi:hypothetical protein
MENKGILVYCIANQYDESLKELAGMDENGRLYAVGSRGLFAIVSDVSLLEYDDENMTEKGEDIEWLKEKAQRFMDIILKINVTTSIIPMKFLTIFTSEDRVRGVLDDNFEKFTGTFEKINGCEELNVKVYCDDKLYKEKMMGEEIKAFDASLAGKPKGAAFFLKKKFEGELDDKLQDKIYKIANGFAEELGRSCVEMKSNKVLAKEITGVAAPMVLNCAFLVNATQKEELSATGDRLTQEYAGSGFSFDFSGPWPPYSFCE